MDEEINETFVDPVLNCEIDLDEEMFEETNGSFVEHDVMLETLEEIYYKNQKVHPLLECSKLDAMQMVLAFFMRHNLTFVALEDLMHLINKILGNEALPTSKYFFFKLFSKNYQPKHVFFCKNTDCGAEVTLNDETNLMQNCKFCKTDNICDTSKSQHYFVTLPIATQLKEVIRENINHFIVNKTNHNDNFIRDIIDGHVYQELPEQQRHRITLTLNTDGVEVFKSSKNSLWPIQAIINEMDVKDRFKTKNILLLGVFYYHKHPNMQLFLKNTMIELQELKSTGLEVTVGNKIYHFDVNLLCGTFDGPAKAAVQNLTQHNGYHSCHYCEQLGEAVEVNEKGTLQVRYCYKENVEQRNHSEALCNMREAAENNKSVKGNRSL